MEKQYSDQKKSRIQGGGWGGGGRGRGNNNNNKQFQYQSKSPRSFPHPQKPQNTISPSFDNTWIHSLPNQKYSHLVVKKDSPFDVYIGRPSKWGNPFKIGPDGSREDVIRLYKEWLTTSKEGMKLLSDAKIELPGKVLACFCAPLPCHGHVLADLVNNQQHYEDTPKEEKQEKIPFSPKLSDLHQPPNIIHTVNLSNYLVKQDGLVLFRKVFTLEQQQLMCHEVAKFGRGEVEGVGSFFSKGAITLKDGYVDPEPNDSDPNSGLLNITGTKARMNVPFEYTPKFIWDLCSSILEVARTLSPSIPPLDHPTIWRLNYYSPKGRIGWHSDRHPHYPMEHQNEVKEPVFSVSLGNTGIFNYRKGDEVVSVSLESGDVIIFGGPSRMIVHQVPQILPGTRPKGLDMGEMPEVRGRPGVRNSFNHGRYNFAFYDNRKPEIENT